MKVPTKDIYLTWLVISSTINVLYCWLKISIEDQIYTYNGQYGASVAVDAAVA